MLRHEPDDVRIAAESIYGNIRPMNQRVSAYQSQFDINRAHSINLISEDLLGGYMQDGRMSVVRRFFCLFVTFDLVFISLLWLICIMINGDSIFNALQKQVMHYTIYVSLFDVVGTAICRFVILLLFYGVCYINHWLIIAMSTSCSCIFLISKVFYFDWVDSPQPIFGVVLIVTSFVLSWGEAWFFDCRVIPQERHARSYFSAFNTNDRSPLMAPFLASEGERPPPESIANFYSPYDSIHNSDDEEEQDEDYRQMGLDCVRKAYELLQSNDWKVEKVTQKGDTIQSIHREKLGKIYRLTGRIKFPAKALLDELFHKIEAIPRWNPTLLESKILRKVNTYTDISYQATIGGGGGLVKCRDFVNLRCWRLCRDGKVIEDSDDENDNKDEDDDDENILNRSCEGSVSTTSAENDYLPSSVGNSSVKMSKSSVRLSENRSSISETRGNFRSLSKSLGAKDFQGQFDFADPPPLDDDFHDANDFPVTSAGARNSELPKMKDKIYVSAAISIEYPSRPPVPKYIRGENLVSCWAMREVEGKSDVCIFEWILCLDLKGYMPRYVLDNTYTTFMTDYMTHLRKYVTELRQKRKKSAAHRYSALEDEE